MDARQTQEAMMQIMHRFQKLNYHALSTAGSVTQGEFFTLKTIAVFSEGNPERGGVYVSELAGRLRVSPPAVSRMLRAMEERGLVERSVDKGDRRNTAIVLTAEGAAVLEKEELRALAFFQRVLSRLGDGETTRLMELWNQLIDIMAEEIAKETTYAQTI